MRLATVLGVCCAFAGSLAVASGPASVRVPYGDLDLLTETGTQTLYGRIVSAARQVCGSEEVANWDFVARAQAKECEKDSIARAVRDVHNARLAAMYTRVRERGL